MLPKTEDSEDSKMRDAKERTWRMVREHHGDALTQDSFEAIWAASVAVLEGDPSLAEAIRPYRPHVLPSSRSIHGTGLGARR